MKFIDKVKTLAKKQDINGLRIVLENLGMDSETYSAEIGGFGSFFDMKEPIFYYSEGEAALVLIDTEGCETELADEEIFNNEAPLWFSENTHRVSPFAQLNTFMCGLMESLRLHDDVTVDDYLCILVTKSYVINYDVYEEVFDEHNGVVFHNVQDFSDPLPVADNNPAGGKLIDRFLELCSVEEKLHELFEPFRINERNTREHSVASTASPTKTQTPPITDYFDEEDLQEFFDLEDPDFKTTEEVVNTQTGEKISIKKDADLPPVNILEPIADPQSLLNEMIGLDHLKNNISEIVSFARYTRKVQEAFPNVHPQPVNLHSIIIGNPGTGKTTMCRIYGSLLHKAGVLSRGHTVVASRGSFIGQQFGTEELRMRQCIKLAQGGCLFIDEAGLLFSNPHPHDPGRGVIQLLLQLLAEEENRDIAVVLALYANDKSLERLYDLNPGIKSRFVNVLSFPDYSLRELTDIARKKMKARGLTFTPKAWQQFCTVLKEIYDHKDRNYGNAREVVNLLQRCIIKHAVRCERRNITGNELLRITVHDIPGPQPVTVSSRRIGF